MTQILFGEEARAKILCGAERVARAVISTLGPAGRNVVISRGGGQSPIITKDGVTVANSTKAFDDPFEDLGLRMIKEAAKNTNKTGDGTTSATLLTYEMMKRGLDLVRDGANAIHVKRGMDIACQAVVSKLVEQSILVDSDSLQSIATISSQDASLGKLISETVLNIGLDGGLMIERGDGRETLVEVSEGFQIGVGFASNYFAKNGKAKIQDPYVLVTTEKIVSIRDLSKLLEAIRTNLDSNQETKEDPIRLVIFSSGVDGDALTTLAKNHVEHPEEIECIVLNPPYFGARQKETLEDIAIATGARLIDKKTGLSVSKMGIVDLGTCQTVISSAVSTTIIGQHGRKTTIDARVAELKERLLTSEDSDKSYLQSRIAGLAGKIATIRVGGSSAMEQIERFHRVEDAVAASRAAIETGIIAGGGTALIRCENVELGMLNADERKGANVVIDSLSMQAYYVASNAGENGQEVVDKIRQGVDDFGFNAEKRIYGTMVAMNIVDPCKVPVEAIKNAVSVAGMFITTDSAIYNPENVQS